jgi:hypothetical protein
MKLELHHNSKLQNPSKSYLESKKEDTDYTFSNFALKLQKFNILEIQTYH